MDEREAIEAMDATEDGYALSGGALILAAGFARRFGGDKRLHHIEPGRPMLLATLERYKEGFTNTAVVLRAEDDELARRIADRFGPDGPRVITTSHAAHGMAHSLAEGVAALCDWDYLFVGLGDMPFVAAATLKRLERRMRRLLAGGEQPILRPRYRDIPGHPVGFPSGLFEEICALRGDRGAQALLKTHPERLHHLELEDPGVLEDIDRPPSRLAQSSLRRQDS